MLTIYREPSGNWFNCFSPTCLQVLSYRYTSVSFDAQLSEKQHWLDVFGLIVGMKAFWFLVSMCVLESVLQLECFGLRVHYNCVFCEVTILVQMEMDRSSMTFGTDNDSEPSKTCVFLSAPTAVWIWKTILSLDIHVFQKLNPKCPTLVIEIPCRLSFRSKVG